MRFKGTVWLPKGSGKNGSGYSLEVWARVESEEGKKKQGNLLSLILVCWVKELP